MKTWNNTDKSVFKAHGEWDDEPDKAHWVDAETGLDCLIHRGPHGALCGYVGVPESHEHFGRHYDEVEVDVHGGLTFGNRCRPSEREDFGICHPKEGAANETVWWLGFDCAHWQDFCPKYHEINEYDEYRNFAYVKAEVESLAKQLAP